MAIKVEPTGTAKLMTGLAKLAGESITAQREAEQVERQAAELRRIQAQQEQIEMVRQWEKEKVQLDHRWAVETENRAKGWELEKLEIASRVDFQREEKKRQQELDQFDASKKAIEEYPNFSPEERQQALGDLMRKRVGLSEEKLGKQPSPVQQAMAKMLGGKPTTETTGITPTGIVPEGMKPIATSIVTAVDLLGQIETGKRTRAITEKLPGQKMELNQRLMDSMNTLAGFKKIVEQEEKYQNVPDVFFGYQPSEPSGRETLPINLVQPRIERWEDSALNSYDVLKIQYLTEEEMATVRSALASGDQKLARQIIQTIKQMKLIPPTTKPIEKI